MSLELAVKQLYNEYGQRKSMGVSAPSSDRPHYFLLRSFMNENDLLVILNTKRCRYQCNFCQLPAKSSKVWISTEKILAQFEHVVYELKHALSVIDRVTLSNEGSVLDAETLPREALLTIAKCVHEMRRVRTLVLETRLEFVDCATLLQIQEVATRVKINILTGFETHNPYIRDKILFKRESLESFLQRLDQVARAQATLTCYVLFKPDPSMSDAEAFVEAENTIDYLVENCQIRGIPLSIRLNPMYLARGSKWSRFVEQLPTYQPPRLTDVMRLAEKKVTPSRPIYIGLSTEGLDDGTGNYTSREDYSPDLIKPIKLFNDGKISKFNWSKLS